MSKRTTALYVWWHTNLILANSSMNFKSFTNPFLHSVDNSEVPVYKFNLLLITQCHWPFGFCVCRSKLYSLFGSGIAAYQDEPLTLWSNGKPKDKNRLFTLCHSTLAHSPTRTVFLMFAFLHPCQLGLWHQSKFNWTHWKQKWQEHYEALFTPTKSSQQRQWCRNSTFVQLLTFSAFLSSLCCLLAVALSSCSSFLFQVYRPWQHTSLQKTALKIGSLTDTLYSQLPNLK